jgi:uncharacterized cupredoxin-like copper-binding protein
VTTFRQRFVGATELPKTLTEFDVEQSFQLSRDDLDAIRKRFHYQAMLKNPEMEHEEANMITLAGSKTGEMIWQFTKAGKVDFACLQPGHYDAGMKGAVSVTKTSFKATSR